MKTIVLLTVMAAFNAQGSNLLSPNLENDFGNDVIENLQDNVNAELN